MQVSNLERFMHMRTLLLTTSFAILLPLVATPSYATAESGIERFVRKVDEARPRGRLLRKIFGKEEEAEKDSDEKKNESDAKSVLEKQTPTLAKRPEPPAALKVPDSYRRQSPTPAYRGNENDVPLASSEPTTRTTPANTVSLGVSTQESAKGLRITRVQNGSPADKAGLQAGDYILEVAGLPVEQEEVLEGISGALNPGDQVEAKISRNGKKESVMIQFGDAPEDAPASDTVASAPLKNVPTPAVRVDSRNTTNTAYSNNDDVQSLRATVLKQQEMIRQLQRQMQNTRNSR